MQLLEEAKICRNDISDTKNNLCISRHSRACMLLNLLPRHQYYKFRARVQQHMFQELLLKALSPATQLRTKRRCHRPRQWGLRFELLFRLSAPLRNSMMAGAGRHQFASVAKAGHKLRAKLKGSQVFFLPTQRTCCQPQLCQLCATFRVPRGYHMLTVACVCCGAPLRMLLYATLCGHEARFTPPWASFQASHRGIGHRIQAPVLA